MLSAEDSPVQTSVQQEKAQESMASSLDCGGKWRVSFARFDRDTCSWRTAQCCLFGDLDKSSVIWPRSGMTVDGYAFLLPTVERPTRGTGSGFSGIPTPRANDAEKRGNFGATNPMNGVAGFVRQIPTPSATDWKCSSKPGQRRGQLTDPAMGVIPAGGRLNPEWVEWLMNWPIGATSIEEINEGVYRAWKDAGEAYFRSHGVCEVWFDREATEAPQGQKFEQQRFVECGDYVPDMPQGRAHEGRDVGTRKGPCGDLQDMRQRVSAETITTGDCVLCGMPHDAWQSLGEKTVGRVTYLCKDWKHRIFALGNGQVPRVHAAAWRILTQCTKT